MSHRELPDVPSTLFTAWLQQVSSTSSGVLLYREQTGMRPSVLKEFGALIGDHFVGEATILKMGGYAQAAETIVNSLPTSKRTQSGDLGELIATEYVDAQTPYRVPIRKLRWKSDRQMPMHGNDVVAVVPSSNPVRAVKVECKSRAAFAAAVVEEAANTLDAHDGRPNPSTLAFITKRLYEENRDTEADVYKRLQADGALTARQITHVIFALSGRDPSNLLSAAPKPKKAGIRRNAVAVVVDDHADFVAAVYATHGIRPTSS